MQYLRRKFSVAGAPPELGAQTNAGQPPAIPGSLYILVPGAGQKCIFLDARAELQLEPSRAFSRHLVVHGGGADDGQRTLFPVSAAMALSHPSPRQLTWTNAHTSQRYIFDVDDEISEDAATAFRDAILAAIYEAENNKPSHSATEQQLNSFLRSDEQAEPTPSPQAPDVLASGELLRLENVDLARYELDKESFQSIRTSSIVTINKAPVGISFLFYVFETSGQALLQQEIHNDILSQFHSQEYSMIWVLQASDEASPRQCFRIRFPAPDPFVKFRDQFAICLYEVNNQASFDELKDVDQGWVRDSTRDDMEIEDSREEDTKDDEDRVLGDATVPESKTDTEGANSQLAVAANNDRTFVVRGSNLGVFATTDEGPVYKTMLPFQSKGGDLFSPNRVMLHDQDASMLVLHPDDETKISRMDLERGEIVDEWGGTGSNFTTPVRNLARTEKYSNMTPTREFIGLNANALLRFDPRSPQIVSQSKTYAKGTRARLEVAATTGAGHIAVASENGDIRLFDTIGKNAKTHLPGLGDKIASIDVTEDGFFVLATTEKYLLLIDTRVSGQEKGGFLKSMGKDKPPPRKLTLRPEDIAKHRMGEIKFTPAHFNTGRSLERSIVTSTGPFLIIWNFRQVKQGRLNSYQIRRYRDDVVADDFAFDNDGKIIVTLPNDVTMNSMRSSRP